MSEEMAAAHERGMLADSLHGWHQCAQQRNDARQVAEHNAAARQQTLQRDVLQMWSAAAAERRCDAELAVATLSRFARAKLARVTQVNTV